MPDIDHPAAAAVRLDPATAIDIAATLFAALELSWSRWVVVASAPGEDKASKHGVAACDALRCHSTCFAGGTLGSSAPVCLRYSGACRSAPSGGAGASLRLWSCRRLAATGSGSTG